MSPILHGGNIWRHAARLGCEPCEILDMSSNVNPFGPMPDLIHFLKDRLADITALPEPHAHTMVAAAAGFYDISSNRILAGNGTTQWIHTFGPALGLKNVLIASPTYGEYANSCRAHGIAFSEFKYREDEGFLLDPERFSQALHGFDAAFICNPNNPTGALTPRAQLKAIFVRHPETLFIVDESYLPFCDNAETDSFVRSDLKNVLTLQSMSKIFRIPGLRIGLVTGHPDLIERLSPHDLPWSVNAIAQAAVRYIMERPEESRRFMSETRQRLAEERQWLNGQLTHKTALKVFPSVTSFVMVRLPVGHNAQTVAERLLSHRILIRNCDNFSGLDERFIRISLKDRDSNRQLVSRLEAMFSI